jgi:hypothetical protein
MLLNMAAKMSIYKRLYLNAITGNKSVGVKFSKNKFPKNKRSNL